MALSQVTVTGATGPGVAVTALVITNVRHFSVDCIPQKLSVVSTNRPGTVQDYDIAGKTTLSLTCNASGVYTLTVA